MRKQSRISHICKGDNFMGKALLVLCTLCFVPALFAQAIGPIQTATVTLTSAQLQHLKNTPVQLTPAPGTGRVIFDIGQQFQYRFGSTPYRVAADGKFSVYTSSNPNSGGFRLNAAGFLDQSASQLASGVNTGTLSISQSSGDNSPLMVANIGSEEFAEGDGSVIVTVYYTIVDLQ
jgi:hypothetical protein